MSVQTPQELEKLVLLMDTIHSLRMSIKMHFQKKIHEYNYNITFEMFQVLAVLWRTDGINQQDIANLVQKNKSSLTPLIDNLAKRDLVIRTEDAKDRRNKIISLTKEGLAYRTKLEPMISEFSEAFKIGISIQDIEKTTSMLRKLHRNITKE